MFCRSLPVVKSTIFNMIAGLTEPASGHLNVPGVLPQRKHVNRMKLPLYFRSILLPWAKLIDNVTMPLTLRGVSKERITEEAGSKLVGLKDYMKVLPVSCQAE